MEKKHLEAIYSALKGTGVNEIKLETKDLRFEMFTGDEQSVAVKQPVAKSKVVDNTVDNTVQDIPVVLEDEELENSLDVHSGYIGFFTRFDPKTKKQCVKLRAPIKKGDVVAFVKSLHVSYPIVSDKEGKIVSFLVEEGQPIEYRQPVIRLEIIDEK